MQEKEIVLKYEVVSFSELEQNLQILVNKAKEQTAKSYSPYSKFSVGAAVLLENGEIVCGNNQENIAYPSGLCAERVAMFYANSQYPDIKPKVIAIAAKNDTGFLSEPICPCGACRQVLLETELRYKIPLKIILYGENKIILITNVEKLLPFAFSQMD